MIELFGYYRSSASYRVRIALNLKNLEYQQKSVHLVQDGGQQFSPQYTELNPQQLVPSLRADKVIVTQSLAIIQYLDDLYPEPALWPTDPTAKAFANTLTNIIACDIHPLDNLRVLKYLKNNLHVSDEQKTVWYQHWIEQGFAAIEKLLHHQNTDSGFCCGTSPTIADLCLIPQVYNAKRFSCNMDNFPLINRINEQCLSLPAFAYAIPENQPDAPQ